MAGRTGVLTVTVIEAVDLPATTTQPNGRVLTSLNPYCAISVDGNYVGQTDFVVDTHSPRWDQTTEEALIQNAASVDIAIFHAANPPPDVFVCNVTLSLEDLIRTDEVQQVNGGACDEPTARDMNDF